MKASELIKFLKFGIKKYGDQEMFIAANKELRHLFYCEHPGLFKHFWIDICNVVFICKNCGPLPLEKVNKDTRVGGIQSYRCKRCVKIIRQRVYAKKRAIENRKKATSVTNE